MDPIGYVVLFVLIVVGGALVAYYRNMRTISRSIENSNRVKISYVNSVIPTNAKAEDNMELMSQMRPSDEVMKYVNLKCTVRGRRIDGFIAVTKERLIFKTVTIGDSTTHINNGLANAVNPQFSFRFDVKEEMVNIPINKVTSMSVSTQSVSLDDAGCGSKPNNKQGHILSAYVLGINTQGMIYKLFLGSHKDVATEFSRTFTSMTFDDEE